MPASNAIKLKKLVHLLGLSASISEAENFIKNNQKKNKTMSKRTKKKCLILLKKKMLVLYNKSMYYAK